MYEVCNERLLVKKTEEQILKNVNRLKISTHLVQVLIKLLARDTYGNGNREYSKKNK